MTNPSTYTPQTPAEFIGPANKLARLLEQKAKACLLSGEPVKMLFFGAPGIGKPKIFGEGQRVTVDGEPGAVIDSPAKDAYVIKLDTGETVKRMSATIKPEIRHPKNNLSKQQNNI